MKSPPLHRWMPSTTSLSPQRASDFRTLPSRGPARGSRSMKVAQTDPSTAEKHKTRQSSSRVGPGIVGARTVGKRLGSAADQEASREPGCEWTMQPKSKSQGRGVHKPTHTYHPLRAGEVGAAEVLGYATARRPTLRPDERTTITTTPHREKLRSCWPIPTWLHGRRPEARRADSTRRKSIHTFTSRV